MNDPTDPDPDVIAADQERVVLAGEYVLGTLTLEERARVEADMRGDGRLRGEVVFWERCLLPLAATVTAVAPPAALWRRIERSVRTPTSAGTVARRSTPSLSIWKGATAASFLLAAGIAFVVLLDRVPMPVPVAVLSPIGGPAAAFVVEARADGVVQVLPLHPAALPSGHELELWSLAEGATVPRSLGLLPASGRKLRAAMLPSGAGKILVSLEPRGGSPTGLPTGPVLYGGVVSRPN